MNDLILSLDMQCINKILSQETGYFYKYCLCNTTNILKFIFLQTVWDDLNVPVSYSSREYGMSETSQAF